MYIAPAIGAWDSAECVLWWSVFASTSHTSTNACVCMPYMEWLQLWGMWLAIWRIVLPVGRFSVHSWFPFQSPLPLPLNPQLLFCHMWTHTTHTHRLKTLLIEPYTSFTVAFFGQIVVPPSIPVHTQSTYNKRVLHKSRCFHLKHQHCLLTRWEKSLFLFGNNCKELTTFLSLSFSATCTAGLSTKHRKWNSSTKKKQHTTYTTNEEH